MSELFQALTQIRQTAVNDTELGSAFEGLAKVFFEHDSTQTQQYSRVWRYEDWARNRPGYSSRDIGIDLVAELADGSGYAAIQCKFYDPDHSISKGDLDSFISASASSDFKRLVLIDTSNQSIGKNAQSVFDNLDKEYLRIQTNELEDSRIDWAAYRTDNRVRLRGKKQPFDHQIQAVEAVRDGFNEHDRGKLIMACGTGKTFTSLVIAETLFGAGKNILYMVPSLALMSQTIREWKNDSENEFTAFSACSDVHVGRRKPSDDEIEVSLNELAFPATTDASALAEQVTNADPDNMTVVFSTYQSIDVISQAQNKFGMGEFDLVVCDEAHRTTGATLIGEDESNFVRIHNNEYVQAKKRLYMTATPRIFGERAKRKADEGDVELASMDDEETFGTTFFYRGFGWAVENNLLTDYKVVVLAVDEGVVSERLQRSFIEGNELKLDDATKIVGCYKALAKIGLEENRNGTDSTNLSQTPMKRALAFSQNIKLSKMIESEFNNVVTEYETSEDVNYENKAHLEVEISHVDGTFNAARRTESLNWLKDDIENNQCRVLTNVRCLSEGVDVPALDAIMFLHPRKSQIDVVQAVGRVMRKAEGKDLGYVILPVTVAPGVDPATALNNNDKYRVVWQILNALRAHDERFDSTINRIGLGEDVSDRLEIVGVGSQMELEATTAVVEDVKTTSGETQSKGAVELIGDGSQTQESDTPEGEQFAFVLADLTQAIKAKIVEKCGTRDYWETWATDIAKIAQQHITRINALVLNSGTPERESFLAFLNELRDELNPEISEGDAVEMLAQHIITRPVFDSLFQGNQFTEENAISKAMGSILVDLYHQNIVTESESLESFYQSVKRRSADVVTSSGRQKLILELYDRFFKNAFPLTTQRLGIVYTPVEVVDFIIHSVEDVLREEFNSSISDDGVHVLDPFTGTGTFITRLLQSGLISSDKLSHKYQNEIHANEIVLLAYYIAAINIEAVYQDLANETEYQPFQGIVLTDTFQMNEDQPELEASLLPDNADRRTAQSEKDITVIIGNPPYSVGQSSANDNAANVSYPSLDRRIESTYAKSSTAANKNALYDSYIRAFRWASDRIGDKGVIGFVSNAGWIDGRAADGFRNSLQDEYSNIYVLNLRGNARTSGEERRKERGNVFGEGTRTPVAITILVKNPDSPDRGKILLHTIEDYFTREQKLAVVQEYRSVKGINSSGNFISINPDKRNDWINQGDTAFAEFIPIGDKSNKNDGAIFSNYTRGVETGRDAWIYNFSSQRLLKRFESTLSFYNQEVERYSRQSKPVKVANFVNNDSTKIKWTPSLHAYLSRLEVADIKSLTIEKSLYRPFTKTNFARHRIFMHRLGQNPKIFPNQYKRNRVITVTGIGSRSFSCLMTDLITCLDMMEKGQCFPLRLFEFEPQGGDKPPNNLQLFTTHTEHEDGSIDGISDHGLAFFQHAYPDDQITKENLFYYIYGVLHSTNYQERFQNNLSKGLPRIPAVTRFEDFMEFSILGRELAELHVNYENVDPYPVTLQSELLASAPPEAFYRVEQMKFAGKRPNVDKSTVIYNHNITIRDIPLEAYEYVVNGKPALQWVMEQQVVKTHKDSGITNDANDYANETMNNPKYPLELFQRAITVSLETMKIVKGLPKLDID